MSTKQKCPLKNLDFCELCDFHEVVQSQQIEASSLFCDFHISQHHFHNIFNSPLPLSDLLFSRIFFTRSIRFANFCVSRFHNTSHVIHSLKKMGDCRSLHLEHTRHRNNADYAQRNMFFVCDDHSALLNAEGANTCFFTVHAVKGRRAFI